MFYLYGKEPHNIIEAKNIEYAIKKIKMAELYPENQAIPSPFKKDEDGYAIKKKNYIDYSDFGRIEFHKIDESLIDKAFVPLYEGVTEHKENDKVVWDER